MNDGSVDGVNYSDPCYYCGRSHEAIKRTKCCGSQEFAQGRVNQLCNVLAKLLRDAP